MVLAITISTFHCYHGRWEQPSWTKVRVIWNDTRTKLPLLDRLGKSSNNIFIAGKLALMTSEKWVVLTVVKNQNLKHMYRVEENLPAPAVTGIWLKIEVWSSEERANSLATRLLTTHQRQFDGILASRGNQLVLKWIRAQHKLLSIERAV